MKRKSLLAIAAILIVAAQIFIPGSSSAQKVACGGQHSLFLCPDGFVNAWGWNQLGQLGNGFSNSNIPLVVDSLSGVTDIGGGVDHSVALKNDGTVWAWGYNLNGELGNGTNTDTNIPTQVIGLSNIVAISSMYHSLALKPDSTIVAWGYNGYGELGNGNTTSSNVPLPVSNLTGVIQIACGYYHSLAVTSDSTVWAWGGVGGTGTMMSSNPIPIPIVGLASVTAISGGNGFSLAIKNDGTVWAWGSNNEGELGIGTTAITLTPTQVTGLTNVVAISAGVYHSLAIKSDGTVWAWGFNMYGQLGNGTNTDSHVPVQVPGLTGIVAIAAGYAHSLAMKNDGTAWTWGQNSYGQLGDGTNADSNVPVQVDSNALCYSCNLSVSFSGLPDTVCIEGSSSFDLTGNPSGGIFTGAGMNGNTFNPSIAGVGAHQIIYSYSQSSDCNASDTQSVFVDVCGAVNNLSDESSLVIYPNPADEFLSIKNSFVENETVTVKIFDVAGREIYSSPAKTSNLKLETRNLENGIYFCQLKSGDKIFNQKFIVQH